MKKDEILFAKWLIQNSSFYEIEPIFPDFRNSQVGKSITDEMLEEGFLIEAEEGASKERIKALINLEVSKRIIGILEEKKSKLYAMLQAGKDILEDEKKLEQMSIAQQEEVRATNKNLENEIIVTDETIGEYTSILEDENIVSAFLDGELIYSPANAAQSDLKKAKEIIASKDTENKVSGAGDYTNVSAFLALLDEAIRRADEVLAKYDSILSMLNKEIQQESEKVAEALGEEGNAKVEEKAIEVTLNEGDIEAPKASAVADQVSVLTESMDSAEENDTNLDSALIGDVSEEKVEGILPLDLNNILKQSEKVAEMLEEESNIKAAETAKKEEPASEPAEKEKPKTGLGVVTFTKTPHLTKEKKEESANTNSIDYTSAANITF